VVSKIIERTKIINLTFFITTAPSHILKVYNRLYDKFGAPPLFYIKLKVLSAYVNRFNLGE
jgi:hypothetical protein